jgi:hypothetical protein
LASRTLCELSGMAISERTERTRLA